MEYTTLSKESKMGKQQKTYTREFKMEAVQLIKGSGKPMIQVARDLEISESALYHWSRLFLEVDCIAHPKSYRRFVQQAVRKSWLLSLLARLARVMGHGSLLLAIAPQRLAAGGLGSCACLAVRCGFAAVDSARGSGAATPGRCRRCSVRG